MTLIGKAGYWTSGIVIAALLGIGAARSEGGLDLSPKVFAERVRAEKNPAAIAKIPPDFKFVSPGKFTVASNPWEPPVVTFATDTKTLIGTDPAFASLIADSLGLELEIVPVAWEDWPLGLSSGKFDAVISNVTVTEERKEKFDFSTYRNDVLGFYVKSDNPIKEIRESKDIAGLKIITSPGTNQEKILLEWDRQNVAAGLKPIEVQYYDDRAVADLAIQSGRADARFDPNATLAYAAATNGKTKLVGIVSGGWPLAAEIAVATRKGSGLADAFTLALNDLLKNGKYGEVLKRWQLESEGITESKTNPPGLPKTAS